MTLRRAVVDGMDAWRAGPHENGTLYIAIADAVKAAVADPKRRVAVLRALGMVPLGPTSDPETTWRVRS